MFGAGLAPLIAFYDTDYLTVPLPFDYILREGWGLRFFDNNGVDATDDMDIQIMVMEMDTASPDTALPPTAQRNHARAPGVIDLTITPTAPTQGVFPIFEPGAAQLTITPVAPLLYTRETPPAADLTITTSAPTVAENFNIVPGLEALTITSSAPTILVA